MPAAATLRISAKNLGQLALPGSCPRCFWLGLHYDLPFTGPFPGIFSSLDSFSKNVVHAHFDRFQRAPAWLSELGEFSSYLSPPSSRTFFVDDLVPGTRLTGAPDGILVRKDGSKVIIDYKTARHTETQDRLLPIYEVQLNGYALIADHLGMGPVRQVALVYTEPMTKGDPDFFEHARTPEGFRMGFHAKVVPVALEPDTVLPLLRKAVEIFGSESPPQGAAGCEDCSNFELLRDASRKWA